MKIGFFDSGLGGLTILKEVVRHIPQYDYVYFGDTANLPYGDKSEEEIYKLTKQAIVELFNRDCQLVVVACNTASAESLRKLQDTFLKEEYPERRVLGVIVPTLEELLTHKSTRAILLATNRTVASKKYDKELEKLEAGHELVSVPVAELVPLLEEGKDSIALEFTIGVLEDMETGKGDVVILGCTHYALLKEGLRKHFPETIFISQDEIIPYKLSEYLNAHLEIAEKLTDTGERTIHLTEHKPQYDKLAGHFLGGVYVPEENE